MDKFKAIALLDEITIKRRYLKENTGEEIQSIRSGNNILENDMEENVFTNARKIYVKKKIDCELYTNEHVSYSLVIPLKFC